MTARFAALIVSVAIGLLATSRPVRGQDALASARQLYASAEYHDALTMLDGLVKANPAPKDRQTIDLYRAFCLFAIGGVDQATTAVDEMIRRDPLYHPNLDEVPPRLRTLFSDARRRLLPTIIQQRYLAAKTAFDSNDYRAASEGFTQVLIALADPDIAQAASQAPLADLKVLATGFNDLTIRSLAPPPAPAAASSTPSPAPTTASPPATTPGTKPAALASAKASAPPPSRPPAPAGAPASRSAASSAEVYTIESEGVTEPVVIRQSVPDFPGRVTAAKVGVVDVVISETGAVESATMTQSIDPVYNRLVLAATKTWQYQPARRDGAPVKFLKRIQIAISPGASPAF
jgi:tetratricopeptide (TPR) repeat protein